MIMCKEQFAKTWTATSSRHSGASGSHHPAKPSSFKEALQPESKPITTILKKAKALAQAIGDAGFRIVSGGTDNTSSWSTSLGKAHAETPKKLRSRAHHGQ